MDGSDKSGVSNPFWKAQIKAHTDATTGFGGNKTHTEFQGSGTSSAVLEFEDPAWTYTRKYACNGTFPFPTDIGSPSAQCLQDARDEAVSKAFKRISDIQTAFHGGQFLGELRETLSMIRHPADSLKKLILGEQFLGTKAIMRRARTRQGRPLSGKGLQRSLTKAAGDSWLEYSFGWIPFLSDIESAKRAYDQLTNKTVYKKFTAVGRSEGSSSYDQTGYSLPATNISYTVSRVKRASCIFKIYGEAFTSVNASKPSYWGFKPSEFVPTAWELLPYSFLADYFTNIGDILTAVAVDTGAISRVSSVSVNKFTSKMNFINFATPDPGPTARITGSGQHPPVTRETKDVVRVPNFNLYIPPLQLSMPGLSSRKWLNVGALIAGRYKPLSK